MRYQSSSVSLALAVLAVLGLASPAAAAKEVRFKGSVQAVQTFDLQFPTLFVDGSGSGRATQLGRFTVTYEGEINLLTGAGSASAHFIAANGDTLFTEFAGKAHPTENPNVVFIVDTFTITGGTGRFTGATGSFTMERLLDRVSGVTFGSFEGTISTRGRRHHDDNDDHHDDCRDND